jgi:RNA-directed DNA polymerase
VSQGLAGVRKAAKENKEMKFTALLHHLTVDLLRESFYSLKRKAAPGVDGVTWQEYEDGLEDRLIDLHGRVHRGARSFDNLDKSWLVQFVEHRVADLRILRLIQKWLNAGVMEEGEWSNTKTGSPQGSVISPLLANIYLHYAFDLWVNVWRQKWARGEVVVIRYADDTIAGFQYQTDADRFLENLPERLAKFGLELHPDKTRRIEFGRFAEENRKRRGEGKPETFDFLGFTHISGKNRLGRFAVRRLTIRKRMRSKLREIKQQLRPRMHDPVRQTGAWLRSVVQGYFNYYAVPGNIGSLSLFRDRLLGIWWHTLCRRSQQRLPWKRLLKLGDRWLPRPIVLHPYPAVRFAATHPR